MEEHEHVWKRGYCAGCDAWCWHPAPLQEEQYVDRQDGQEKIRYRCGQCGILDRETSGYTRGPRTARNWATGAGGAGAGKVRPATGKYSGYAGTATPRRVARRPTHSGKRALARRPGSGRTGYETPRSVQYVLDTPKQNRHRFTETQWKVLELTWGGWSGYQRIGSAPDMSAERVRRELHDAERIAYEIYHVWLPAYIRWTEGRMRPEDRAILAKHKRQKKGRREAPETFHVMDSAPDHLPLRRDDEAEDEPPLPGDEPTEEPDTIEFEEV